MKRILFLSVLFFFFMPFSVYASDYVMPYPPIMPGGTLYKIRILAEEVKRVWSFGSLAQFKYNLEQSDKYLVQAKTLIEYKQYLLASNSLEDSTRYFQNSYPFLLSAKKEGKDISEKESLLKISAQKHIEILNDLLNQAPKEFSWTPENGMTSELKIHELINFAIKIRKEHI